jgi:hypothetical protein
MFKIKNRRRNFKICKPLKVLHLIMLYLNPSFFLYKCFIIQATLEALFYSTGGGDGSILLWSKYLLSDTSKKMKMFGFFFSISL